jgi:hypothetical protein
MRVRAEELAIIAQSHGAKVTPEDFMPKRATGMGPEVYHAFAEAFEVDGKT